MDKKQFQKALEERTQQRHLESIDANYTRAQSISVGSSSGGTTEINMRTHSGAFVWNVYEPNQVVEIIYQLSASIGCNISIQPRDDFSSWRTWREPTKEKVQEKKNVATKKAVNKRSAK